MSIPLVLWIVIAAALAIVYAYRRTVVGSADELVHLNDASNAVIVKQEVTATKVQQLDRVVMILAILFVVYGIALGGLQIYQAFTSNSPSA